MTPELHPTLYELVPSVAYVISRKFKGWVDPQDIKQECFLWAIGRGQQFTDLLNEPEPNKREQNEKRIAYQMQRMAERFARKEKARKAGYRTTDEAFYDTATIAQLIPFVITSIVEGTVLEQAQDILQMRYHDNYTLQQIAQYLECATSTADRRSTSALRRLQDRLGGKSPWN
jgi:hypothetical protein